MNWNDFYIRPDLQSCHHESHMLTLMTHLDGLPYVLHKFAVLTINEMTLGRKRLPHSGLGETLLPVLNDWGETFSVIIWQTEMNFDFPLNNDCATYCAFFRGKQEKGHTRVCRLHNGKCLYKVLAKVEVQGRVCVFRWAYMPILCVLWWFSVSFIFFGTQK